MSKPIQFPRGTTKKMQRLVKKAKTASEVKRVQSVLLGSQGMSSIAIVPVVGFTEGYIRKIWKRYREQGDSVLLGEKRGGRHNANLSLKEEKEFLSPFFSEAKEAGILIVSGVHKKYEQEYKKQVKPSVIYNLLHRHGWRKIVPKYSHPKADEKAQEEFKAHFPPQSKKSSK